MEFILQFILELILDFVLQVIGEILAELGLRLVRNPLTKDTDWARVLRLILSLGLGILIGALSLLILPHPLFRTRFSGINMLISPLLAGAAMACVGTLLRRHNKNLTILDNFVHGFLFALGMSVTRFIYAD